LHDTAAGIKGQINNIMVVPVGGYFHSLPGLDDLLGWISKRSSALAEEGQLVCIVPIGSAGFGDKGLSTINQMFTNRILRKNIGFIAEVYLLLYFKVMFLQQLAIYLHYLLNTVRIKQCQLRLSDSAIKHLLLTTAIS
jgi:hypothetical protein